jgi:predicted RNase H-like nuclease
MKYSKTGQPAAAFWERIEILEAVDSTIVDDVRDVSADLAVKIGNDDVIDAFALALTASPKTGSLRTLPDKPPTDDTGNLPMEMVYAYR